MTENRKNKGGIIWIIIGSLTLLILQSVWIYRTYLLEKKRLQSELQEALAQAYQKEQAYRIPVVDMITPGEVSIQSCGNEEIIIIRKCAKNDTIIYSNTSGYSVEKFIQYAFTDLREHITPLNLYCLSDLFAGILHDKDIPLTFKMERYNILTDSILEISEFVNENKKQAYKEYITLKISDKEAIRAQLQNATGVILKKMASTLFITFTMVIVILFTIVILYQIVCLNNKKGTINELPEKDKSFNLGKYIFVPSKNELYGFGKTIQLNKKENSILYALCLEQGVVVERNTLLKKYWGESGTIYSRSLDTYVASLRKYLKEDSEIQIVTVKGVGYKLVNTKP